MQQLIDIVQKWVAGYLQFLEPVPIEIWYILFMFIFAGVVLGMVMLFAGVASYAERKVAGHMQSRHGPNRVGPHGVLQFVADGIKLVLKEDLIPDAADKILFRFAPYIVFLGCFAVFAAFPFSMVFGQSLGITNLNIGLLYVLAISSIVVVGIIMAGWASGNKWSLLGGLRSAAQIVSYEVPIGVSFLTIVMIAGTLDLFEITRQQDGGFWRWFVFRYPPFTMSAFFIYFVASLAETNRVPFDIPEAESEIVAGYHTEYSGMRFSFFYMSEYGNMLAVSSLATIVFLGGFQSVLPFHILPGNWFVIEGLCWFFGKALFLVFVQMWLRWTLPRYRVDQLMHLAWKVLLPFAFVNIMGIGIWMLI
ncbi:MAG: NADH-quinone oxidoreductase subunit NuoH [Planctomycetes bacterium]|nr:NADH-quinone oxidoreductase subunit NuoH [Planctomycetota bacterium]